MRTRMYGGVRGRKTKVGRKLTLFSSYSIWNRHARKFTEILDACISPPTCVALLDLQLGTDSFPSFVINVWLHRVPCRKIAACCLDAAVISEAYLIP